MLLEANLMLENFTDRKDLRAGVVRRMWSKLANELIQDAPEDVAICEFDGRKPQCANKDWSSCERRLKKAEGELMPVHKRP